METIMTMLEDARQHLQNSIAAKTGVRAQIIHRLEFRQGPHLNTRRIVLRLNDTNGGREAEFLTGTWRQGESHPAGINLYANFTPEDKTRLKWRWYRSQLGGLIQVGNDMVTETIGGKASKSGFECWLSFQGAKRLASGKFVVSGTLNSDGEGRASYDKLGSSDTFEGGERAAGQWLIMDYDW
jgi:hypothetical protein